MQNEINGIKLLLNGVRSKDGKYISASYSVYTNTSGAKVACIYARCILNDLPAELGNVQNESDSQTDYFEEDRVTYQSGTAEFAAVEAMVKANEAKFADLETKRQAKRAERAGKSKQAFVVTGTNRKGEQREVIVAGIDERQARASATGRYGLKNTVARLQTAATAKAAPARQSFTEFARELALIVNAPTFVRFQSFAATV
jgi:hypothetical protein